ncbi:hypothetical protein H6G97_44100 [Nostoc flagelliforme FACHB-838]|uniref:Transposase n=1 Tax=Nostoc flagelliforme FACHB-838 TaxID=2692904 RepID=A0ABR8E2Y9_9NOSO|nr:hypothetical protein [Nostoc flagelliforme]MBD2535941.1 hypothetical protein [Nostoc flagelliforme FACHB-838]
MGADNATYHLHNELSNLTTPTHQPVAGKIVKSFAKAHFYTNGKIDLLLFPMRHNVLVDCTTARSVRRIYNILLMIVR